MDPTFLLFVLTVEEVVRRKGALTIFFLTIESGNWEIIVSFLSFLISFG